MSCCMITPYDVEVMAQDVRDIITSWDTTITMYVPKPEAQQTHWNAKMREYVGPIDYDSIILPANRQDYINNLKIDIDMNTAGRKDNENTIFVVPDIIQTTADGVVSDVPVNIPYNAIFQVDDTDNRYYVSAVKVRIGEYIIIMKKYVGGTPSGNGDIIGKN